MKKVNKFEAMRKLQNKNRPKVAGSMIQGGLIKYQTRGELLATQAMEQLDKKTPFADFYETFPVGAKGTAKLGDNYIPQTASYRAGVKSGDIISPFKSMMSHMSYKTSEKSDKMKKNIKKLFMPKPDDSTCTTSGGTKDPSCQGDGAGGKLAIKRRTGNK